MHTLMASEDEMAMAENICRDETTFSDRSGLSNKQKWSAVVQVFDCADCSLFTEISFEEVYHGDDALKCTAAAHIADLRVQYLYRMLVKDPADGMAHMLYIRNRQWQARLMARLDLSYVQEALRGARLT